MEQEKLNYNLKETPWYFGAYLNMARHNAFLVINHLTEKFSHLNFSKISDDKNIDSNKHILANIFDTSQKKYDEDRYNVYKYLVKRHYLPFIKIFHDKKGAYLDQNPIVDYDKLHQFLSEIFKTLNDFRNSYTHYLAIDDSGEIVENRTNQVSENVKTCLIELFQFAPEYSLSRFEASQEQDSFKHLKHYKLFEKDSCKLTEHGFYFLINLFLERSYASKFLKKIRGFKDESTPSFKATLQTYTAYSLRVPDERLGSENLKDSLLLEMLNELQKCPKELYNHISDKDKSIFEPKLEEESISNLLDNTNYNEIEDKGIDLYLSEITSLKRHSNRFPYFALRYIDEFDLLPNIRFQITLGKLQFQKYEKNIAGTTIDRRILKTINAFGKLSDFENRENEVLENLNPDSIDDVHFDQFAPHYNLNNNKIGFCIVDNSKIKYPELFSNSKKNKPDGFISLNDLPKLILLAKYDNSKVEKLINDFIEINQNFILNFNKLNDVKNKLNFTPEIFSRRRIKERKLQGKDGKIEYLNKKKEKKLLDKIPKLLDDNFNPKTISNEKNKEYARQIRYLEGLKQRKIELQKYLPPSMLVNQLPTEVLNYLLNLSKPSRKSVIHEKIKAIKDDCKWLMKILNREKEKPREEQNIKLGEIATFLARDIISMVINKEVKQKITSVYYNKLQNKIAYFSISKEEIESVCQELELFDNKKGHVFLTPEIIHQSSGVLDFYESYLEKKIKWIENNLFIKGKNGGYYLPDSKKIPYAYLQIEKQTNEKDFEKWLVNKSKMPVNIPTSLFNVDVEKTLQRQLHVEKIAFNRNDKFSILLSKLLKEDTQAFYNYERIYFNNEKEIKGCITNLSSKAIKDKFGTKAEKNEKKIRFIQTQDKVLKLLCDTIIDSNIGLFNLKNFIPFSDVFPLNQPYSFKQNIVRKGKDNYFTIIAEDSEHQKKEIIKYESLKTEEEKNNYQGQKGYEWTIKDFGKFKRFVNDRRIPFMSYYFTDKNVSFDFIKYQLYEYDKYRELVFKAVFELEKEIAKNHFNEIRNIELKNRKSEEFFDVQFKIYLDWLDHNTDITIEQKNKLQNIRNGFSHSQFPEIDNLIRIHSKDIVNFEKNKHIKGKIESLNLSISKHLYIMLEDLIGSFNI